MPTSTLIGTPDRDDDSAAAAAGYALGRREALAAARSNDQFALHNYQHRHFGDEPSAYTAGYISGFASVVNASIKELINI